MFMFKNFNDGIMIQHCFHVPSWMGFLACMLPIYHNACVVIANFLVLIFHIVAHSVIFSHLSLVCDFL